MLGEILKSIIIIAINPLSSPMFSVKIGGLKFSGYREKTTESLHFFPIFFILPIFFFFLVKQDYNKTKLSRHESITIGGLLINKENISHHRWWIQKNNKIRNGASPKSCQDVHTLVGLTECVHNPLVGDGS